MGRTTGRPAHSRPGSGPRYHRRLIDDRPGPAADDLCTPKLVKMHEGAHPVTTDDGPSPITTDDVTKVAALARLELTPAELDTFTGQLADILDHAADLSSIDSVEATGALPVTIKLKSADRTLPQIFSDRAGMMASPTAIKAGAAAIDGARAVGVRRDGDRVTGVEFVRDGRTFVVSCRRLVVADGVRSRADGPGTTVVVLDLEAVYEVDTQGSDSLSTLAADLRHQGPQQPSVRLDIAVPPSPPLGRVSRQCGRFFVALHLPKQFPQFSLGISRFASVMQRQGQQAMAVVVQFALPLLQTVECGS